MAKKRDTALVPQGEWTPEQIELIKNTIAKGTSDDELKLFLYVAKKSGLDPLAKQIHAVMRYDSRLGHNVMAIQTGIDGYRLAAERTGKYAPGRAPTYTYTPEGKLKSATAFVQKFAGGQWHEVAAVAMWEEYVQIYTPKNGVPKTGPMWAKMPHLMLAKCAEALALRRAFPMELSGIYTTEEMAQADTFEQPAAQARIAPAVREASDEQRLKKQIADLLNELGAEVEGKTRDEIREVYRQLTLGVAHMDLIPENYKDIIARLTGELQDRQPKHAEENSQNNTAEVATGNDNERSGRGFERDPGEVEPSH